MQTPSRCPQPELRPFDSFRLKKCRLVHGPQAILEAAQAYKRLSDENPRNAVYLNKLGIALHQQEALGLALKLLRARAKR